MTQHGRHIDANQFQWVLLWAGSELKVCSEEPTLQRTFHILQEHRCCTDHGVKCTACRAELFEPGASSLRIKRYDGLYAKHKKFSVCRKRNEFQTGPPLTFAKVAEPDRNKGISVVCRADVPLAARCAERGIDVRQINLAAAGTTGCEVWDAVLAKSPIVKSRTLWRPVCVRAQHVRVVVLDTEVVAEHRRRLLTHSHYSPEQSGHALSRRLTDPARCNAGDDNDFQSTDCKMDIMCPTICIISGGQRNSRS